MVRSSLQRLLATLALLILGLSLPIGLDGYSLAAAQTSENPGHVIRFVRSMETADLGILNPAGLSYAPQAESFLVASAVTGNQTPPSEIELTLLTPTERAVGSARIFAQIQDPINMTFDGKANRLLFFKSPEDHLLEVSAGDDGGLLPATLVRHQVRYFGLQSPQGMTIDPDSGHLYFLDTSGPALVRVAPDASVGFDNATVVTIQMQLPASEILRGIAFDATTGHLHILSITSQKIYEVQPNGEIVAARDISEVPVADPQAMVFAPSGDQTDDPAELSLYLADAGAVGKPTQTNQRSQPDAPASQPAVQGPGQIIEFSFVQTVSAQPHQAAEALMIEGANKMANANAAILDVDVIVSSLVNTVDTWTWTPPSPDPAGIVYMPATNELLVSDSEVDEMTIFAGSNIFASSLSGTVGNKFSTLAFSSEPTGITLNPANSHLFISDDVGVGSVYEVDPGSDGNYFTADDIVMSFSTEAFGSFDPEGVTFDPVDGVLFVIDGVNNEIYRIDPKANGFDGVSPDGDDEVISFDTEILGLLDPEGITYEEDSNHLYAVGEPVTSVAQISKSGELLRMIDISAANADTPAGLTYGPGSVNASEMHLYVVDRRQDNDINPNENDGQFYELTILPLSWGNTPPVADAGIDQTILLPDGVQLNGTLVSDDGTPVAATTKWQQLDGPGLVTFDDANALNPTVSFSMPGVYVLRLTATDGELSHRDEVTITVTGASAVLTLDAGIAATNTNTTGDSSDDAEEVDNATSSLHAFSADLDMLFDRGNGETNKLVGLRFNTIAIPADAVITNAYIQFTVDESSGAATTLVIEGEATANPVTFGFGSQKIGLRPRTSAAVTWSPPPWLTLGEALVDQRTPNLAPVVQEILGLPGWTSGNSMVFIISGSGERTAFAYEGDPASAPRLHIEYYVPASLGNYVWDDANENGLQDEAAENGVNDVTVELLDSGGAVIDSTVTANDDGGNPGYYSFSGLIPGNSYRVRFTAPAARNFTTQDADGNGIDGPLNSDVDPTTGQSGEITLAHEAVNVNLDAGLAPDTSLAVSLSYVYSERASDERVRFVWETTTETGNAGFNIYADLDGEHHLITPEMVPSKAIDSLEPVRYVHLGEMHGETFHLEMIGVSGRSDLHGPFQVGSSYGMPSAAAQEDDGNRLYLPIVAGTK